MRLDDPDEAVCVGVRAEVTAVAVTMKVTGVVGSSVLDGDMSTVEVSDVDVEDDDDNCAGLDKVKDTELARWLTLY